RPLAQSRAPDSTRPPAPQQGADPTNSHGVRAGSSSVVFETREDLIKKRAPIRRPAPFSSEARQQSCWEIESEAYFLASCELPVRATATLLQAPRRVSSMAFAPVKDSTGPTLDATVLQAPLEKVSEVAALAMQVSPSHLNIAPPAMNFAGWVTAVCSLATTGSAAKAGAADRVATAAQAAARVRSFMMRPSNSSGSGGVSAQDTGP